MIERGHQLPWVDIIIGDIALKWRQQEFRIERFLTIAEPGRQFTRAG